MSFFNRLQKLTTEELKELSVLCGGLSLLVGITLLLSGNILLPNWLRLSFLNTTQAAATYTAVGSHSYVVPAGVSTIFVDLWGGGGMGGNTGAILGSCDGYVVASASYGYPGGGGFTYAKIPVTPGETLTIVVGAANGGGIGGANGGTAGGGYSGIFRGTPSQANALAIAGGGGGSGSYVFVGGPNGTCGYYNYNAFGAEAGGGGGGTTGGNGGVGPGTGGTQSAGGTGTISGGALTGGNASGAYRGGGGAGYWGGGSGTATGVWGGGGGGGSGYCAPTNILCSMLSPTTPGIAPYSQYAPGGAGNASVGGAVVIATGAVDLTASPASIDSGNTSQLNWTTSNISPNSCTITDDGGNLVGVQGLGTDYSGEGNLWTLNNLSATDQLIDTPTNNFATLHPAYFYSPNYAKGVIQGGGLNPSSNYGYAAGWQLNSGKWYWETLVGGGQSSYPLIGVWADPTSAVTQRAFPGYIYDNGVAYGSDGLLRVNGLTTLANVGSLPTFGNDDVIGTAYDADTGKVYFSKNGTWLNSANPAAGTGYVYMVKNGTPGGSSYYGKSQVNFGQGGLVPGGLGQGVLASMAYYWNMNDNTVSGSSVSDLVGGNTGVLVGAPPSTSGKYAEARSFNGSSQYMYTSTVVSDPQLFTLSVWFKTTSASGHKIIGFESEQNSTDPFNYDRHIYMGSDGYIRFGVYGDDGTGNTGPNIIESQGALNNGAWHHAVATFDETEMKLYIDGTLASTKYIGNPQTYNGYWRVGGYKLGLSSWDAGNDGYFNGSIDDVRIYNSKLSASDVSALYAQTPPSTILTLTYNASAGGKFAYTPPSGFKALSTANLPTPATSNPSQYFDVVSHTSTGSGNITINSLLFAPDLAWIKSRTMVASNTFWDRVRGNTLALFSDQPTAQTSLGQLASLNSDGATIGYGAGQVNYLTHSYMDYFFKEGATPGFDIVTWTGDGTGPRSIAHTLGTTPDLIIAKRTDAAGNWYVGGNALGGGKYALLNSNAAALVTNSPFGVDLIPTMTAATTNGVTMSGSTEYQAAWRAGDKTLGANYWYTYPNIPSVAVPQWLKVDLGTAKTVGAYSITTYYNEVYYLPLNFTFQGSNDNSAWTTLDTQTNVTWTGYSNFRTFTLATPGSYRYYRVHITKADRATIIAELNLWQSPVPSTAAFTVASSTTNSLNTTGASYVAYLFSNREGYLKTGTYLANNAVDGPFIYTGFKPKFILARNIDGTNASIKWSMVDSVRNPTNPVRLNFAANLTAVEYSTCCALDFLTNGFKPRNNDWEWNGNAAHNFLYLAIADAPFKSQYTGSGYSIPNSLRMDTTRSTYLSRTAATAASSTQKQTLSMWLKRGNTGLSMPLFVAVGGSNIDQVRFNADDTLTVFLGGAYTLTTTPVYRDPSAWMHLVIKIDTTQGSPNSVKIYVNGVQQPLTGSYPPAGYNLQNWNKAGVQHYIGRNSSLAGPEFDGALADVYFVDGLALNPTSFGAYDSNGDWKPIAYTGTVGNNGSHVTFSDTGNTNFSTASGSYTVGPLYQTTTYTMACISSGDNVPIIDTATVSLGGAIPALSLSANPTATTTVGTSTLTWTSGNVNANSCSVTELTPANVVSAFSSMGAGDNTSKITSVLSQAGTYTYKLACAAPYASPLYNGTLTGSPGTGVAGKYGEAANFAASTAYLLVPQISLASGTWTIASWFKTPLPTGLAYNTLTRGTNDHQILVQNSNSQIGTYDNTGATGFHGVAGFNFGSLSAGWHHVAAVGSGSATTYYIDGASIGSANFKSSSNIVAVGNYQGGGQQFGTIDDTRVYNRALAADEVSTLYQGGHILSGLVAYWPFDTVSISGTSASDLALGATSTTATVTVTSADICTDISGNQTSVPTGCQTPNPSPGICIPSGKTWNGSQCVAVALPSGISLSSTRVRKGDSATLNWTVTGMSAGISCSMSPSLPGGMPAWDSLDPWYGTGTTGAIAASTLYTLTCGNGVASTSAATTVGLLPLFQEI